MTELLDAVDALTKPTHTLVVQWVTVDGKDKAHSTRVEHDPLLQQLEEAIASTIGGGGGRSMTAKWALNVLDSDALYQFSIIDTQIRDWCRGVGVKPGPHPLGNLRAFYAAHIGRLPDEARDRVLEGILRKWAGTIRGKMNPPRTMELTAACPVCGSDTWTDADGITYRHPITITYQDQDADILGSARALCRACERVWRGAPELRALRWDVDALDDTTKVG
jgi:hypothetical protein